MISKDMRNLKAYRDLKSSDKKLLRLYYSVPRNKEHGEEIQSKISANINAINRIIKQVTDTYNYDVRSSLIFFMVKNYFVASNEQTRYLMSNFTFINMNNRLVLITKPYILEEIKYPATIIIIDYMYPDQMIFRDNTNNTLAHPHIDSEGKPCLGGHAALLENAELRHNPELFVITLIQFLKVYTDDDAYFKFITLHHKLRDLSYFLSGHKNIKMTYPMIKFFIHFNSIGSFIELLDTKKTPIDVRGVTPFISREYVSPDRLSANAFLHSIGISRNFNLDLFLDGTYQHIERTYLRYYFTAEELLYLSKSYRYDLSKNISYITSLGIEDHDSFFDLFIDKLENYSNNYASAIGRLFGIEKTNTILNKKADKVIISLSNEYNRNINELKGETNEIINHRTSF